MEVLPHNWSSIFVPDTPVLELVIRASILYLLLLLLLRLMPRRTGGELATMDLVFFILIANAATPALGDYKSVADGAIVIAILMAWNYLLNALSYYSRFFERITSAPSIQVVRNGKLMRRNMRREFLTEDELMHDLRKLGIEKLEEVKAAYIEGEGHIAVIRQNDAR